MTRRRRNLEWLLVDTHLWVSSAAAGLSLFAAAALGFSERLAPMGVVFSATLLIYAVDDVFDGRTRIQPARWLTVVVGGGTLLAQLLQAPIAVVVTVAAGSLPALLYAAPIRGRRLRELPAVKPFFVAFSLSVGAVAVPLLWATNTGQYAAGALPLLGVMLVLFLLVLCNVCFFDLRDREVDARTGVRTLPLRLGERRTRRLCLVLCMPAALAAVSILPGVSTTLLIAIAATATYVCYLPVLATRLHYALVVDGVPILLGLITILT